MKYRLVLTEFRDVQRNGTVKPHYPPVPGYSMRFSVATADELPDLWLKIEDTIIREIQKKAEAARVDVERHAGDEKDLTGG